MAHKNKIGGTNYEIVGGKAKIDGTNVSNIEIGKTLTDTTNYYVSWQPVITVIGNPEGLAILGAAASVHILQDNGNVPGISNGKTLLPKGTILRCSVGAWVGLTAKVIKNGEMVSSFTNDGSGIQLTIPTKKYDYTVIGNATIECEVIDTGDGDKDTYGIITITEH